MERSSIICSLFIIFLIVFSVFLVAFPALATTTTNNTHTSKRQDKNKTTKHSAKIFIFYVFHYDGMILEDLIFGIYWQHPSCIDDQIDFISLGFDFFFFFYYLLLWIILIKKKEKAERRQEKLFGFTHIIHTQLLPPLSLSPPTNFFFKCAFNFFFILILF